MKVAIYIRTSRTDQILDNQKIPLLQYVEREGWEYELFQEQESTRKTRPIQHSLYNRLLKKEFDGVLVYKFDRWARSTTELVNHLNEFMARNIRFISYTENIDLGTPTGKLMFTIISAMAEFERELIRERTLAGLARAKARGKKLGRPRGSKKQGGITVTNGES
jgi:DNA invertase Pin-like site-specific DNA recombinase|tara:strand:+ start:366 stop:857 length:492 start_codon:yes stop_codon:yes gene_type:complete